MHTRRLYSCVNAPRLSGEFAQQAGALAALAELGYTLEDLLTHLREPELLLECVDPRGGLSPRRGWREYLDALRERDEQDAFDERAIEETER